MSKAERALRKVIRGTGIRQRMLKVSVATDPDVLFDAALDLQHALTKSYASARGKAHVLMCILRRYELLR